MERRSGNRLTEIAEALAHHYAETTRAEKAFEYLAMAGNKSLDTYAISEAEQYYRKALELFEVHSECAASKPVVLVIISLLETLILKNDNREVGVVARKFMPFVKKAGETPELVIAYYHQWASLQQALELRPAHEVSVEALMVAERLGEGRARAYARGSLLNSRVELGLDPLDVADRMKSELIDDSLRFGDNFITNWSHWFVAYDYLWRGLYKEAREAAMRLLASGGERDDPRAIGMANVMLGYLSISSDDPVAAAAHGRECQRVAVAAFDRLHGAMSMAVAGVFLGHPREGLAEIEALHSEFKRTGSLIACQHEMRGVALALLGRISEGTRLIRQQIVQFDAIGDHARAAWCRIILAEIYIQILSAKQKPEAPVLLKNFSTIIGAMIFGAKRARALLTEAAAVKMFSERGVIIARINFDLGVLSAMKKKCGEARSYFEKARVGAESQGADKLLQKIDAALAELQGGPWKHLCVRFPPFAMFRWHPAQSVLWEVKPISHSQWNVNFGADFGPSRGDGCRRALRPNLKFKLTHYLLGRVLRRTLSTRRLDSPRFPTIS